MTGRAFAALVFAAAMIGQDGFAFGDQDRSPAGDKQEPSQVPAQRRPAPSAPSPSAVGQQPAPQVPNAPAPGKPQPPVRLPPVKIIQARPKPAKPAREHAVAPKALGPRAAVPSAARPAPAEAPGEKAEDQVPMTPVKGSEIPLDKVPGGVSRVSSADVQRSGASAIQDALQQNVPGVIISDATGNPFSTDIQYRGFTASPVEGTPQGLAVYQNGVRINEVFGDTVNWDLIPSSAIKSIVVVSGNPLYGLNALGGALNVTMKDGFGFQGIESDTRAGSYGRIQEYLQLGKQVDNFAVYAALEGIHDDGWRFFSPSNVARMYADLGVKDKSTEFHINFTGAQNSVGVVGPAPAQLVAEDYRSVFTSPQTTDSLLAMLSMNGSTKISDTWSLSAIAYLRSFHQQHVDGNVSSVGNCAVLDGKLFDSSQPLCLATANGSIDFVTDQHRNRITTGNFYGLNDTIGEIDRTTNNTNSFGTSVQATNKEKLLGLPNLLIAGASVDHGDVKTTSRAELGTVNTQSFVVAGNGLFLTGPQDIAPVDLKTTTNYYGLFFSDTLDLTSALSVTVGGRYNYEELQLAGPTGFLTGDHVFTRFNPMAGATYKFNPNLSLYGGYAEANRAPTPAELSCADPNQPCLLQNFLVSDPSLKQVVSKTWQGGFRGNFSPLGYGHLDWTAGVFHTHNYDDILAAISPAIRTRGFFQNAGETQRQGVEASLKYQLGNLALSANYAYVDAAFLSNLIIPSPNNPFADNGNIFVHPGDRIPVIPPHRFKASFDYAVTGNWKVGADVVLASSQYFFGDESNQDPRLSGYGAVNLRTSYKLTENITVYGLINNVFDHKYATYGAFFNTPISNVSGNPSTNLTNSDMMTPAQPFSVYGGLKLKF